MKSIVLLFGAGASYGAGDIIPEQPPLGFQLYKRLAEIYPSSWGVFPSTLKVNFEENFEAGMEIIYKDHSQNIAELMQQMAVYFIQFRPYSESSLYCKLIQDLQNIGLLNAVLFSTLNYECVLEFSLLNQGFSIAYFDKGEESNQVPVWKLHGSCNMFSKNFALSQGVKFTRGISFGGGLQALFDVGTVVEKCLVDTGLPPAMCLYMKGKRLQVSPAIIERLQVDWQNAVMNCQAVICVGVNPLPEDSHIWRPLAETEAHFYFIGSEEAFLEWRQDYRSNPSEFLGSHFDQGYPILLRRLKQYESH